MDQEKIIQLKQGLSRYKFSFVSEIHVRGCLSLIKLLNWERNEVPLNIGGYKADINMIRKRRHFLYL